MEKSLVLLILTIRVQYQLTVNVAYSRLLFRASLVIQRFLRRREFCGQGGIRRIQESSQTC